MLDPSSMSWRVPLGIQLIPAIILALGCAFVLPPSPRLLVLQGKDDAASKALSLLRGGTSNAGESDSDVLVQLELLEMRVETEVVQRMLARELELEDPTRRETGLREEWKAWKKLFSERYRDRTWIGVLIMVFQRLFSSVWGIYTLTDGARIHQNGPGLTHYCTTDPLSCTASDFEEIPPICSSRVGLESYSSLLSFRLSSGSIGLAGGVCCEVGNIISFETRKSFM
jgi:hypothetical protein